MSELAIINFTRDVWGELLRDNICNYALSHFIDGDSILVSNEIDKDIRYKVWKLVLSQADRKTKDNLFGWVNIRETDEGVVFTPIWIPIG